MRSVRSVGNPRDGPSNINTRVTDPVGYRAARSPPATPQFYHSSIKCKAVAMGGSKPPSIRLLVTMSLMSLLPVAVNGHGYLSQPVSRNYFEYLNHRFYNRACCCCVRTDLCCWLRSC
jgi:hypothetical protein